MSATRRGFVLTLLLGGGGVLALAACAGCGIGGYLWLFSKPAIAGEWAIANPQFGGGTRVTIDFHANGTGVIHAPVEDVFFEFTLSQGPPPSLEWRITRTGDRTIRPHGQIEVKVNDIVLVASTVEQFHMTLDGDTLLLSNQNGAAPFLLQRVR
jgi:hypothetical protein